MASKVRFTKADDLEDDGSAERRGYGMSFDP
jgi:hypothetical protein